MALFIRLERVNHLFNSSVIQQTCIFCPLWAKHCVRVWEYGNEQDTVVVFRGLPGLLGRLAGNQVNTGRETLAIKNIPRTAVRETEQEGGASVSLA